MSEHTAVELVELAINAPQTASTSLHDVRVAAAALDADAVALRTRNAALYGENGRLRFLTLPMERKSFGYKKAFEDTVVERDAALTRAEALDAEVQTLRQRLAAAEDKATSLEARVVELESRRAKIAAECDEMQSQRDAACDRVAELRKH